MLNYTIGDGEEKRLRLTRAELLIALRDLMYADAILMEDLGDSGCDYCIRTEDGHAQNCHFANAVDILFEHRAQGVEDIKEEARQLRVALVDLASDDYLMLDETLPCTHCDGEEHKPDCPLHNALKVVLKIKRESLL